MGRPPEGAQPALSQSLARPGTRGGGWSRRQPCGRGWVVVAWVPVVGYPRDVGAGVMRVNVWVFLVLVGIGKAARYALVLLAAKGLL